MSHFTMTERIEQCFCITFCQKLGHSAASETIAMTRKVYGDEFMGNTKIMKLIKTKEWFRRFKNGCVAMERVKDNQHLT